MLANAVSAQTESTIWFDFTTSFNWTRPAVGIVRMEQECCRALLNMVPGRVRACIFDQRTLSYYELPIDDVWRILNRVWTDAPTVAPVTAIAPAPSGEVSFARRVEQVLRRAARRGVAALPARHQLSAKAKLMKLRRIAAYAYNEWKAPDVAVPALQSNAPAASEPSVYPKADIRKTDTYLTMGLDWDHNKIEFLYRLKKEIGFRINCVAYDIIPVLFPHFYSEGADQFFAHYFSNMAWIADHIFCISECTRKDLRKLLVELGTPVPDMSVVRLGDMLPVIHEQQHSDAVKRVAQERFILMVSTIEIRKNHQVLYNAYVRLIEQGVTDLPKLVFVGMPGWRVNDFIFTIQQDKRVRDKIVILNRVTDADLALLYETCDFTVYPSLYEGWGLPVAESLTHGKFCLTSHAGSIPEIAGDILDYLEPWDVLGWAEKIKTYATDQAALQSKVQAITSRYKTTSWNETAASILKQL
ncbi:glycosyltransferase family 4 protein [Noviherbaspirillum saxi]|uniref:Glycosyltransferase family 1 protein n=1 Tax=Noviherbaspirillum saxi TaxID=2320863 RepID=A0A3A3G6N7_9BURK|nr:glycosyltransferase family 1 protein [Noviherbaspirillum saxi]RJF97805.1 glycosyltransferase family 1 protein [Noviherbaspirillum saxi]